MLNLKREEIKTMDRDLAYLQGEKGSKGKNIGNALLEKETLETDLEKRLLQVFSASANIEEPSGIPTPSPAFKESTAFAKAPKAGEKIAPAPTPEPSAGMAAPIPTPPRPETTTLQAAPIPSASDIEKDLEKKIAEQVSASMPRLESLQVESRKEKEEEKIEPKKKEAPAATESLASEEKPAEPLSQQKTPAPREMAEKQTMPEARNEEEQEEDTARQEEKTPEQPEETEEERAAAIEKKIKNELKERMKAEKTARIEMEEKEEEEEKTQELADKIAREKEQKELAEEEEERLKRKRGIVLPVLLREAKERIRADKQEIEKHLLDLTAKDEPLEKQKNQLMAEVELARTGELGLIIGKEKEIEDGKTRLENAKRDNLTLAQEKLLSQRLWEIEDKRKQIERRRWEVEDQITRSEIEIKKIELELAQKNKERDKVKEMVKKLTAKEKLIDFIGTKKTRLEEIKQIKKELEKLAPDTELLIEERKKVEDTLKELTESEQAISEELKMVEEKETQAFTPDEKRVIEKMRWKVETDMRKTTKDKWQHLLKKERVDAIEKENLSRIEQTEKRLKEVEDKISADEIILEKEGINVKRIREEVEKIFQETGFEFDPEVLEEVPQGETGKEMMEEEGETYDEETWVPKEPKEKEEIEAEEEVEKNEIAPRETQTPRQRQAGDEKPPVAENPENKNESASMASAFGKEPVEKMSESAFDHQNSFLEPIDQKPAPSAISGGFGKNADRPIENPSTRWQQGPIEPAPKISSQEPIPDLDSAPPANPWENRWTQAQKQTVEPRPGIEQPPTKPGASASLETDDDFPLTDDLPAKPGGHKKLLIRIIILLVCFAVFGAIFLLVFSKKNTPADNGEKTPVNNGDDATGDDDDNEPTGDDNSGDSTGDTAPPDDTTGDDATTPNPPVEPASLITTISTHTIRTDDVANNLRSQLSPYLQRKFEGEGYYRILIEDNKNNSYAGLKEFFSAFGVKTPDGLLDHLNNDFTLFIYASNGDNRLGLVAAISDANNFDNSVKSWETTMEKDTDGLLKFLGKNTTASPSFFKTASVPNTKSTFRYLSFPLPPSNTNSGLCYTVTDKYFIFTTSGESLIKIFNQLQN